MSFFFYHIKCILVCFRGISLEDIQISINRCSFSNSFTKSLLKVFISFLSLAILETILIMLQERDTNIRCQVIINMSRGDPTKLRNGLYHLELCFISAHIALHGASTCFTSLLYLVLRIDNRLIRFNPKLFDSL